MLQSSVSHYPPSRFAVSRVALPSLHRPAYQVTVSCSDSFGSESMVEQNKYKQFFFLLLKLGTF